MQILSLSKLTEESVSHNEAIKKRVMIRNGEIPHLTNFSRSVFPPGVIAPAHKHTDMYEVFLIESGVGVFVINGVRHELDTGSVIRIDLEEMHEIRNVGTVNLVLLYFGVEV